MRFFDTKPIGAFIEYTVKPLIDDTRELIDLLEKHGLKFTDLKAVIFIYIFNAVMNLITSLAVTGMICYTALHFLHTAK